MAYLLEDLIDPLPQKREDAFNALVALGNQALPCLIGALEMRKFAPAWEKIIQIILQIKNDESSNDIIHVLLQFLKDPNKPIYKVAFEALLTMGDAVIYNIRDILAFYWSDDSWIQGVCALLIKMNSPSIDILVPNLLRLYKIGSDENCLDEYVIDLLCKIGSPMADGVIPLIPEKILGKNRESIKEESILALQYFDPGVVRPLVPILKECLSDPSEIIRSGAQNVLESLGEGI
jgi:hypothetical protein